MKFTPYTHKNDKLGLPVKYYGVGKLNGVNITRRRQGYTVDDDKGKRENEVIKALQSKGVELHLSPQAFDSAIRLAGFIRAQNSKATQHYKKKVDINSVPLGLGCGVNTDQPEHNNALLHNHKTSRDLIRESSQLNINTVGVRADTAKNVTIYVSSNEPESLYQLLKQSQIHNVERVHLEVADIMAIHHDTGDTLYIERKTMTDLYQSVTVGARSHDQAERMFDRVRNHHALGQQSRALWLVEAQDDKEHLLDACLPAIQNISGLIGYLDFINEQSVIQTYSMNHSAYNAIKFMQCFFERKLLKAVKSDNPSIRRDRKSRLATLASNIDKDDSSTDSGVVRHTSGDLISMLCYVPGVSKNVAAALAKTGKSFAEIVNMEKTELLNVDGIGPKKAKQIMDSFQRTL